MRRITAFALVLLMCVTALSIPVYADADTSVVDETCRGRQYHYRDAYFYQDASIYDPSLATMSYLLTDFSDAYSGEAWTNQCLFLKEFLQQTGFVDFDTNEDYKVFPGIDTMGVAAAHKTITNGNSTYSLVVIVPRSFNYMGEWGSNVTIGTNGDAKGFSDSADIVLDFLKDYFTKYRNSLKGEIKLWLSGYSRGGAVANLVAGRLTLAGKIGSFRLEKRNIYAYTFEAPAGLHVSTVSWQKAKKCTNIHNITAPNDVVTILMPAEYGFCRYGTDVSLIPETRDASNAALFERALRDLYGDRVTYDASGKKVFTSETFRAKTLTTEIGDLEKLGTWKKVNGIYRWEAVDTDTAKSILFRNTDKTMSEFLRDVVSALALGIGSRSNYANLLQDMIRIIISDSEGDSYQQKILSAAVTLFGDLLKENETSIMAAVCTLNAEALTSILTDLVKQIIEKTGLDAVAYAKLPSQILAAVPLAVRVLLADMKIDNGNDVITFIENYDILFDPHYPDQNMAWMITMDPLYADSITVTDARVSNVKIQVKTVTTTKKVLGIKKTVTRYNVTIQPVSEGTVASVQYALTGSGTMKTGKTFTLSAKPLTIYVDVIDCNGGLTHWKYSSGTVKQILV